MLKNIFDGISRLFSANSETNFVNETFQVVGVNYYLKNIKKLAWENKKYCARTAELIKQKKCAEKIFQCYYTNHPVDLIPEPTNTHDKNAIMVQINGQKVGYISKEDCPKVKQILSSRRAKSISSFISGGVYKVVSESGDVQTLEKDISIKIFIK